MSKSLRTHFLKEFPKALNDGTAAVFVGAGVSMAAGYPSWATLLKEIGEELGVNSNDVQDLTALAQWSIRETGSASRVRDVILKEIKPQKPIPPSVEILARLPVRHIWTTNYDLLIERAFDEIHRPYQSIASGPALARRVPMRGATRLYKMHGCVNSIDEIVISTDDYELYRSRRGQFLPLFQAHLTGMSMLFIGISFTDPNIKHVLSLIRESFIDAPPEHFAIVRPPQRSDFTNKKTYEARLTQHRLWAKDLQRYGLKAVEVERYDEIPELLKEIERRLAANRIWVSGSWPLNVQSDETPRIYQFAEKLGKRIADTDRDLVTGAGVLVGSASLQGFVSALRKGAEWDIDRRLTARPFPQPLEGQQPDREEWTALRTELAKHAGAVVFVGGMKVEDGKEKPEIAKGVLEEFEIAKKSGAYLLPIAATGGAAVIIHDQLKGSSMPFKGANAQRPSDKELKALFNQDLLKTDQGQTELLNMVFAILDRLHAVS